MSDFNISFENGSILNGRYRTDRPLNHGSFGMVFMATDLLTNNKVALKCMPKYPSDSTDEYEEHEGLMFDEKSEELMIHERLGDHAGIVSLLDSFDTPTHLYLVLEYCERGDLYEAIRSDYGPGETEHVRKFMLQIVDAVEYMHSRGVAHRDLKPENIFITKSGDVKLGDFGLATTEEWCEEKGVGSDRYMSPEQYDHQGNGYSPAKSDIWSVGVCLLNILFSRNPFTTPTEKDPLFRDFLADRQSLFDVFPDMSKDTFNIISKCMSIDPSQRSLADVREALLNAQTFTELDEDMDEFFGAETPVVPDANRAPLRTPSIQSPIISSSENPFFSNMDTRHRRNLSVIADEEAEDPIFDMEPKAGSWTESVTPVSSFAPSQFSKSTLAVPRHIPGRSNADARPIPMAHSQPVPSLGFSFGGKGASGVSWSDLADEDDDFDFSLPEAPPQLDTRSFSHDSIKSAADDLDQHIMFDMEMYSEDEEITPAVVVDGQDPSYFTSVPAETKEPEVPLLMSAKPISIPVRKQAVKSVSGQSTSSVLKQGLEKWEALGQRRRAKDASLPATPVYDFGSRSMNMASCGVQDMAQHRYASRNGRDKGRDGCHNGLAWAQSKNWREHRPNVHAWVGLDF